MRDATHKGEVKYLIMILIVSLLTNAFFVYLIFLDSFSQNSAEEFNCGDGICEGRENQAICDEQINIEGELEESNCEYVCPLDCGIYEEEHTKTENNP